MRARNLQRLTDDTRAKHPGVVIYGLGDAAHQAQSSDHNDDDTPGIRTPQTDGDSLREHRAIDIMLGPHFTREDGWRLVNALLANPASLARLTLIIFDGWEWAKRTGWLKVKRTRDLHLDHIHVSGDAADDENTAPWNLTRPGGTMSTLDTTFAPAEPTPEPAAVSLNLAIQRLYQAVHHGDMTDGYTARTFPNSIFAVLARLEAGLDAVRQNQAALMMALQILVDRPAGAVSQEQVDAAAGQVLADARFGILPRGE